MSGLEARQILIIILFIIVLKVVYDFIYTTHTDAAQSVENFTITQPTGVLSKEADQNIRSVFNKDYMSVSTLNADSFNLIQPKTIIMWYGTASNIPAGWALCNGANGTPNLTDRFIMAGTTNAAGNASINASGTVGPGSAHTHTPNTTTKSFYSNISATGKSFGSAVTGYTLNNDTTHTHGSATINAVTQMSPKWASLVFIMKT